MHPTYPRLLSIGDVVSSPLFDYAVRNFVQDQDEVLQVMSTAPLECTMRFSFAAPAGSVATSVRSMGVYDDTRHDCWFVVTDVRPAGGHVVITQYGYDALVVTVKRLAGQKGWETEHVWDNEGEVLQFRIGGISSGVLPLESIEMADFRMKPIFVLA